MSNPVSVKRFSSTMAGAPSLTGAIGGIIPVLDAFLINGFGSVTLTSLVVASGMATATVNTGHGFQDHQVVLIAGATPSGLNGDKRIEWLSATQFSFDATGISDGTATGTITAKNSPLGWTKAFSGTNKAVYAKQSGGTAHVLRVDDTATIWAALNMYNTMSDVDTGTDVCPTSGSFYIHKSTDTSTARQWRAYGDALSFYLFGKGNGANWLGRMFFGDIVSDIPGDLYHCALIGHPENQGNNQFQTINNTTAGHILARSVGQIAVGAAFGKTANFRPAYYNGTAGSGPFAWPNAGNNRLIIDELEVWEPTCMRGVMPGLYNHSHTTGELFVPIYGDGDLAGRRFVLQPMFDNGSGDVTMPIDMTGPWR